MIAAGWLAPCGHRRMGCVLEETVVGYRWQLELGGQRVETLKSVSSVSLTREFIEMAENTPEGKLVSSRVSGPPSDGGTLTLTRAMDKSDTFTKWIRDSLVSDAADGSGQDLVLVYVNAKNEPVKKFLFEGAFPTSWSGSELSAGDSSATDETIEISYVTGREA
ncbi:phage tail protein [Streptomyces sp. NPDC060028]|uniref:phage tail protein n=1 Tax=Streptomyces sp. NPDC060028 TaxID=3347041 RepID=UPI0036C6DFF4